MKDGIIFSFAEKKIKGSNNSSVLSMCLLNCYNGKFSSGRVYAPKCAACGQAITPVDVSKTALSQV